MDWTDWEASDLLRKFYDVANVSGTIDERRLLVCGFADDVVAMVRERGVRERGSWSEDLALVVDGVTRDLRLSAAHRLSHDLVVQGATVATLQAKVGEMETVLSGYESANTEIVRARSHLRAEVEGLKQELDERDELERQTMKTVTSIWAARAAEAAALHTKTREHLLDKEEECKRLSAEVEMLKAEGEEQRRLAEGLSGRIDLLTRSESMAIEAAVAAESRLAATRERIDATGTDDLRNLAATKSPREFARWVLEGDAPQGATSPKACAAERIMPDGCGRPVRCTGRHTLRDGDHISARGEVFSDGIARFPCSLTCTHDDAAKPGHPERVASLSLAISEQATAQNEAWNAMHPNGSCTCGGEGACAWCAKSDDPARMKESGEAVNDSLDQDPDEEERSVAYRNGHSDGAEAMRAACIEKAVEWAQVNGLSVAMQKALKDVLEGVAT